MNEVDIAAVRQLIITEELKGAIQKDIEAGKKKAEEEVRKKREKYDFTYWLKGVLTSGWGAIPTYLPFIPLLWSFAHPGFSEFKNWFGDKGTDQLLTFSFGMQTFIIFCIIIYQLYVYSETEKDGLKKSLQALLNSPDTKRIYSLPTEFFRFTHTNTGKSPEENWEHLKINFAQATKNIFWFKLSWIILWANWFCYYIALLVFRSEAGVNALFDFFMITETLCFFMCYYLLSYQAKDTGKENYNNFWWIVVVIMLLVTLAIVDYAVTDIKSTPMRISTSMIKTLLGCTFLGLLVSKLTTKVFSAPDWVKMVLFFYVALQPMLFGIFDLPSLTELMKPNSRFKELFQLLQVIMFNFSLVLKYILMFYVVWLLKFDHFLVHYLRTQNDFSFMTAKRDEFEKELKPVEPTTHPEIILHTSLESV